MSYTRTPEIIAKLRRTMGTKEYHNKVSNRQKGATNSNWKGDKVGYTALHGWVKRNLPKPDLCQDCGLVPPYDLANISQKYKRDLSDWEWLCRRCHMLKDGRMKNAIKKLKSLNPKLEFGGKCINGHNLTTENFGVTKTGNIFCRHCSRAATQKHYHKTKETYSVDKKQKIKQYAKEYREKHREKMRLYLKNFRARKKAGLSARRKKFE